MFDYGAVDGGILNDGGTAFGWVDLLGNDLTVLDASDAPTYVANAVGGYPGVSGRNGANPALLQSMSTVTPGSNQATVYAVAEFGGPDWSWYLGTTDSTALWFLSVAGKGAVVDTTSGANFAINPSVYGTVVIQFDKTASTAGMTAALYWGRSRMGWTSDGWTGGNFPAGTLYLLNASNLAFPAYSTTIVRLFGYNTLHTEAQIQAKIDDLSTQYGLNSTTPTRGLYVDGDSISSMYASINEGWVGHTVLDGSWDNYVVSSCAYSGKTLATGYANIATQTAQIRAGIGTNYAIVWLGTNDIAYSTAITASSLYATMVSEVSYLLAHGFSKVGVVTLLPRGGGFLNGQTTSGFEAVRETGNAGTGYNDLVRNGAAAHGYTVIDVGSDATIGQAGQWSNTTYFVSDHTHLTDAGQSYFFTNYISPTLTAWN